MPWALRVCRAGFWRWRALSLRCGDPGRARPAGGRGAARMMRAGGAAGGGYRTLRHVAQGGREPSALGLVCGILDEVVIEGGGRWPVMLAGQDAGVRGRGTLRRAVFWRRLIPKIVRPEQRGPAASQCPIAIRARSRRTDPAASADGASDVT